MPQEQILTKNKVNSREFMYVESSQIPLTQIPYEQIKANIINPITGKPYKGIILEGCFADFSNDTPNNNARFYDIPSYLELLKNLRKQIHSPKGVYGELEHPKGYAVDMNNASHKILDIWYDENQRKVFGYVLILNNTVKGQIARDIIESGGLLAISARAAGDEAENGDGTFTAKVKLLTTYDLVYHPGFSSALLEFKELNESIFNRSGSTNLFQPFSGKIYSDDLANIENYYHEYIQLNENSKCFYGWLFNNSNKLTNLSEGKKPKTQDDVDEQKMQDNEPNDQQKIQNELQSSSDADLKEKQNFFRSVHKKQRKLKQTGGLFDDSAGFLSSDNF